MSLLAEFPYYLQGINRASATDWPGRNRNRVARETGVLRGPIWFSVGLPCPTFARFRPKAQAETWCALLPPWFSGRRAWRFTYAARG
jgi:hypothetical protein